MIEIANKVNEVLGFPLADVFEKDLTVALETAKEAEAVIIAMLDLDNFMQINDAFGQSEGDRILIETGQFLASKLSNVGKVYRYGGDAFSILYNQGIEKEEVFLMLESARKEYSVKAKDNTAISISIGISAAPEDSIRYSELVRKAEGAMVRAKLAGKNRICLAREEKMVTKTSHYTVEQLQRLGKLSKMEGLGEAVLLREALDAMLKKYDV